MLIMPNRKLYVLITYIILGPKLHGPPAVALPAPPLEPALGTRVETEMFQKTAQLSNNKEIR